jgi:peptide deformylase
LKDLQLRYWPDPCLRKECDECSHTPAERIEIGEQMIEIMYAYNGYGLSAPQVGLNCRIFVMRTPEMADRPTHLSIPSERKGLIFVNPIILDRSSRMVEDWEGCLSLLTQRTKVDRYTEVTIEYSDPTQASCSKYGPPHNIERTTWTAKGLDARCVQHEIDHLNGIMIFDHINSNLSKKLFLEKYFKKKARVC